MSKRTGWTRRQLLARGASAAAALPLARASRALAGARDSQRCTLAHQQVEGPFYLSGQPVRSDITEGKPGLPLALRLLVLDARSCKPVAGAAVSVWHCDALGVYSGFTGIDPAGPESPDGPRGPPPRGGPPRGGPPPDRARPGPPPGLPSAGGRGPPAMAPTDQQTFLRGTQLTGPDGAAAFQTIFPGVYAGRVNHIHFEVRTGLGADGALPEGHLVHIGQLFFPETLAAELMLRPPYRAHDLRRTTAGEDGIFREQHGAEMVAEMTPLDSGRAAAGYRAELRVSIDPSGRRRPGPGPSERDGGPYQP